MELILPIIVALISSGTLTAVLKVISENRVKNDPMRIAVRMILKRQIEQECIQFLAEGSIPYSKLKYLRQEHDCYHNGLHGNGDLDAIMNDVESLPVTYDTL